jgi:AraC-like DNA-binding protein
MKKKLETPFSRRQYMVRDDFEIYYYSDTDFHSVSPHVHDYYEFYFPVSGDIRYQIQDKTFALKDANVILVPPGRAHRALAADTSRPYQRFIFWLSSTYAAQLSAQMPLSAYILHQAAAGRCVFSFQENEVLILRSQLLRILEEAHSERYGSMEYIALSIQQLLLSLSRSVYEQDHPAMQAQAPDLLQNVLSYIDAHINEDLRLEQLAGIFFSSKYYLSHLFKDNLGLSLHQYILHKRLALCAMEILSGRPIHEVYRDHGFHDYSSFYRAFCREYRLSPRAYQDVYRRDPARFEAIRGSSPASLH